MSARQLLQQAIMRKSAYPAKPSGGQPGTNAPGMPAHPGNPDAHAAGGKPRTPKTAGAVEAWLTKLAAQPKTARSIPGRLDGDETLDKLAAKRSKKKRTCS